MHCGARRTLSFSYERTEVLSPPPHRKERKIRHDPRDPRNEDLLCLPQLRCASGGAHRGFERETLHTISSGSKALARDRCTLVGRHPFCYHDLHLSQTAAVYRYCPPRPRILRGRRRLSEHGRTAHQNSAPSPSLTFCTTPSYWWIRTVFV